MGLPQQPLRRLFPTCEAIATRAECARSAIAEAIKALEWAGVLTWQNRITRILVRERDLFGQSAGRWRVIRTSDAYVFSDPETGFGEDRIFFQVRKYARELWIKNSYLLYWHQPWTQTARWNVP